MKSRPQVIEIKKTTLRRLIRLYGLQSYLFDKTILDLSWEGLEYHFSVYNHQLMLQQITLQMDFPIGKFPELVENNIWPEREAQW